MSLRERPSGSFRSKPAENALAPPVRTMAEVSASSSKPLDRRKFTDHVWRESVDAVAAVEPHHRNPTFGPEPLLDAKEVRNTTHRFSHEIAFHSPLGMRFSATAANPPGRPRSRFILAHGGVNTPSRALEGRGRRGSSDGP